MNILFMAFFCFLHFRIFQFFLKLTTQKLATRGMEVQLSKELKQLCANTSKCTEREKKLLDGVATAMKVGLTL